MIWKAWWLPVVMGCALGAVHVLPKAGDTAQSAVNMNLPDAMNGWQFQKLTPSVEELGTLSRDTEFAKAICLRARRGEVTADGHLVPDRLDLSVVLSGSDLNNSIHRPERCMPAQGHHITGSNNVRLQLPNGRFCDVKRLRSVQSIQGEKEGKVTAKFNCVTYYFFVGHDCITNDHLARTLTDMKDRLVHGLDQRWAYVSVSMWYGKIPWIDQEVPESEADEKLREFLLGFTKDQIRWDQITR